MKIEDINPWWVTSQVQDEYTKLEKRDLFSEISKYIKDRQIVVISGLRRTGKTVIMHHLISLLLKSHPKENVLYFSFDLFDEPVERILELYSEKAKVDIKKEKIFIFLDEIQKHNNWENELKVIYDNFQNIKIFISGSSSLFIEKKTKESLAGRAFSFVMSPLAFSEYLCFRGVRFDLNKLNLCEAEIKKHLSGYLLTGGFPELIYETDSTKISRYVKESVIDKIVYIDIPKSFKIDEPALLESIFSIISSNPGLIFDYDSIASDLGRNRKTISNYALYLEKSFLIKKLYNYSRNLLTNEKKLKKMYPSSTAFSYLFNAEEGRIIENSILMNGNFRFFSKIGDNEVDFILSTKGPIMPIESKYKDKVKDNELKGLLAFMDKFSLKNGIIVTKSLDKEQNIEGNKLKFTPLWRWLLEKRAMQ